MTTDSNELPPLSDITGSMDRLDQETVEAVKMLSSHFYVRDGFKHPDGSMRSLRMSPRQLRALLAFAIQQERERCAKLADDMDYGMGELAAAIRKG